jgi:anhydro-N-acetylmuramic acid kinase
VRTQEELGWSSDAKEAVAFALLADCCVRERTNTLPSVTGASEAVIMGKISLPARGNGACS